MGHDDSLSREPFPTADPTRLLDDTVSCVIQIKGEVRDRIEVPSDISAGGLRTVVVREPKLVNVVPV